MQFLIPLLLSIFILVVVGIILAKEKHINKTLLESIDCKNHILEEYKAIRHEYNNMIHVITGFIDIEGWEDLSEYNQILLEKTQALNKNNLPQLARIKDNRLLVMASRLYADAVEKGNVIQLSVYDEGVEGFCCKEDTLHVLEKCLSYVHSPAELKISVKKEGIMISIKGVPKTMSNKINTTEVNAFIKAKRLKKTFYNTLVQNELLLQEIIIQK